MQWCHHSVLDCVLSVVCVRLCDVLCASHPLCSQWCHQGGHDGHSVRVRFSAVAYVPQTPCSVVWLSVHQCFPPGAVGGRQTPGACVGSGFAAALIRHD